MIPAHFREVQTQNHILLTGSQPHSFLSPCSHPHLRKGLVSVVVLAGFAQPRLGNSSRDRMTAVEHAWDARDCIPPPAKLDKICS